MSIKRKSPGWFVLSVLLFCCADLRAEDKEGFADKNEDLPKELQNYIDISNGKITLSVKTGQKTSMELYFQEDFSFTAIQPSSAKDCKACFKYGNVCDWVGWISKDLFQFYGVYMGANGNVKVDIEDKRIIVVGKTRNTQDKDMPSQLGLGQFQKKVSISISEVTCDIAFAFDAAKFKLLAHPTTTPSPTIEELLATTKNEVSTLAPNEVEIEKSGVDAGAWLWVIVGISACFVLVLVTLFLIWCFCCKKKNRGGEQNKKGQNSSLDGVMHGSSRVRPGTEYSQRTYDDTKPEADEPSKEDMRKDKKPKSEPIGKSGRLQKKAESLEKQKSAPVKKIVEAEQIPGLAGEQVQQQHIRDRDQDNEKPKSDHVYEVIGGV